MERYVIVYLPTKMCIQTSIDPFSFNVVIYLSTLNPVHRFVKLPRTQNIATKAVYYYRYFSGVNERAIKMIMEDFTYVAL